MALYKVSDPGWKPRKPSFRDSFKTALGGALGSALVNVPTGIFGDLAQTAIGTSFGEGGRGWEFMQAPGEVDVRKQKQEQAAALRGIDIGMGELGLETGRRQEKEAVGLAPYRTAAARAGYTGAERTELEAAQTWPHRYEQGAIATQRARTGAEIEGRTAGELGRQLNQPMTRTDEAGRKWQKTIRGDWIPYEEPAPVMVPSGRGTGGQAVPSQKSLESLLNKYTDDLKGAKYDIIPGKGGVGKVRFLGTAAENARYTSVMNQMGGVLDQLEQHYPEVAAAKKRRYADLGVPGAKNLTLWKAALASQGVGQRGTATGIKDVEMGGAFLEVPAPPPRSVKNLDQGIQWVNSEITKQEDSIKQATAMLKMAEAVAPIGTRLGIDTSGVTAEHQATIDRAEQKKRDLKSTLGIWRTLYEKDVTPFPSY